MFAVQFIDLDVDRLLICEVKLKIVRNWPINFEASWEPSSSNFTDSDPYFLIVGFLQIKFSFSITLSSFNQFDDFLFILKYLIGHTFCFDQQFQLLWYVRCPIHSVLR